MHIVSARASEQGTALGQVATDQHVWCALAAGYFRLESDGSPVDFSQIRLRELT